jgi:predicted outer membrane protein
MRNRTRSSRDARSRPTRAGGAGQSRLLRMLAVGLVVVIVPLWVYKQGAGASSAAQTVASDGLPAGTVNTAFGPLTPLDREFVTKVRLAGLWELPSGMMAMTRSSSPAVHAAGQHLIEGHKKLDDAVLKDAAQLGMGLPNQPSDQQLGFLRQEQAVHGPDFDRVFAQLLRTAHGQVFVTIAKVRNSTRNTLVRQLADLSNATVLDHITVLERTGVIDFDSIAADAAKPASPPAPLPPGAAVGQAIPAAQLAAAWAGSTGLASSPAAWSVDRSAAAAGDHVVGRSLPAHHR